MVRGFDITLVREYGGKRSICVLAKNRAQPRAVLLYLDGGRVHGRQLADALGE